MMKIQRATIPSQSILNQGAYKFDYFDCYQGVLNDEEVNFNSLDVAKAFFSSGPRWVERLFAFRNRLVKTFGLKTPGKVEDRKAQIENFKCEPGEQLGLFKVFSKTENEVVLGEDDKHLNFRVSLLIEPIEAEANKKKLSILTSVKFHNSFGRLYFLPVRPFHKLIVPRMLQAIIVELEKRK